MFIQTWKYRRFCLMLFCGLPNVVPMDVTALKYKEIGWSRRLLLISRPVVPVVECLLVAIIRPAAIITDAIGSNSSRIILPGNAQHARSCCHETRRLLVTSSNMRKRTANALNVRFRAASSRPWGIAGCNVIIFLKGWSRKTSFLTIVCRGSQDARETWRI